MPELPEVETVLRILEHQIYGCWITAIDLPYEKVVDNVSLDHFRDRLIGQSFHSFTRKGKYLIFGLDDVVLCCHLRMEGKFYLYDKEESFERKHIHAIFHLSDGRLMCYHDTRKFGRFYLYAQGEELTCLRNLGLEPWDERLNVSWLYERTRKFKQANLKDFLLDQRNITGIGNIYANEICYAMKKHPETKVSTLSKQSCKELIDATRMILERAIEAGGTTIRSYTSSLGVTGRFQLLISVYQKENQPCVVCGTSIQRSKVSGRGTFFCPSCQKLGRKKKL